MQVESPARGHPSWKSILNARHIALPNEHGAWVFLFSPLLIGLFAGGVRPASFLLVTAALAAFLVRQPVTIAVKVFAGRRPKNELPGVYFWLAFYGLFGLSASAALVALGYSYLFWLAVPALPVFAWHLWLVSRRAEHGQMVVEILASGILALSAPAAFWLGHRQIDSVGWLLWGLSWAQTAGSILYIYLRLEQRQLKQHPAGVEALYMARPSLIYNLVLFGLVLALAAWRAIPLLLPLAYAIQLAEVIWAMFHPAVKLKPKTIGFRQLFVSFVFTAAFILIWSGN